MSIGYGRPRRALPPQNMGSQLVAQRRVAEAASRAAEKTKYSMSVDAHVTRIWLRSIRGAVQCPCSSASGTFSPATPNGSPSVFIPQGEGDQMSSPDPGFDLPRLTPQSGEELPPNGEVDAESGWVGDVARMLLGNGRRCGICWGTGWVDGYRLWGGERIVMCVVDTPSSTIEDAGSDPDVDLNTPTPMLVGPGAVQWSVQLLAGMTFIDALRVRAGTKPALGGWTLLARFVGNTEWIPAATLLGVDVGLVAAQQLPNIVVGAALEFRLELLDSTRVSHVELVLRGCPLVNVQLPQVIQNASAELVGPVLSEEFEVDPVVGYVERGTLIEVPGNPGRLSALWMITDVGTKKTAEGMVFGVTGTARNVQPVEVLACVCLDDSLTVGVLDYGAAPRGLEETGGGDPAGLPVGDSDTSLAAVKRGTPERLGGGTTPTGRPVIVLSSGVTSGED